MTSRTWSRRCAATYRRCTTCCARTSRELPGGDEFVLMGLLRERALELFELRQTSALDRLLALVDRALADGDEELADAVASDFISATPPWDAAMDGFVATWPVPLRAQAAIETARFNGI